MEPTHTAEGIRRQPAGIGGVAVLAVFLGVGWSAAALGASTIGVDCESATDPLSAEVPDDGLSVSVVDLTDVDSSTGISAPLDDSRSAGQSAAPLLFLGPRVATIVEDVFGDAVAGDDDMMRDEHSQAASRSSSMAPLAESADEPSPTQSAKPDVGGDAHPALPRVQREMYRTDI